jgi:uncharacterized RDD family membrane protein YckC
VFCPSCGAKNELERAKCFVCSTLLPSLQPLAAPPERERRPIRPRPQEIDAAVGDRALALLFDRLLLAALALIAIAYLGSGPSAESRLSRPVLALLGAVAFLLAAFAYHTLAEGFTGTTLGKAIFGLSVRNESGRGALAASAIRNGLRLADGLGLYLVGFAVALFAPRHRRLGDLAGGTVVLSAPVPAAARAALLLTLAALLGLALWLSSQLCPECVADLRASFTTNAVEMARR